MLENRIQYQPQPKQLEFHRSPANELLFGGAAGPGKSTALRNEGLIWAARIPRLQVYLFRRTYPELEKNHIIPAMAEFPRGIGRYNQSQHRWNFYNEAMFHFCHCQYEKDVFNYQGAEIHLLLIDEATSFTEFIYSYLRGRVRCTLEVPEKWKHKVPGILLATNPGGIGHEYFKRAFVDFCGRKGGIKRAPEKEGGMLRGFIPALLKDNPKLLKANPHYEAQLDALPEPYRTAYKTGNWDIFMGQMFNFNRADHVIKPMPIPDGAPIYFSFDYGFSKPFSCGWWWVDQDDRIHRFSELYGWAPDQPNVGLRLSHLEIGERVREHEAREGIPTKRIIRLCDPTCFNKTPDPAKGGQGPSLAEDWARLGLHLNPGDPNRRNKIMQFHARLRVKRDKEGNVIEPPMMCVYDTCEAFIRTIPLLKPNPFDMEDVDTRMEDHVYDEACHVCMARPSLSAGAGMTQLSEIEKRGRSMSLARKKWSNR